MALLPETPQLTKEEIEKAKAKANEDAKKGRTSLFIKQILYLTGGFLAVFVGRKHPILKWVLAVAFMFFLGVISFFTLGKLQISPLIYPLAVLLLNLGVCLLIQAPRKWIIISSAVISSITMAWIATVFVPNYLGNKKRVASQKADDKQREIDKDNNIQLAVKLKKEFIENLFLANGKETSLYFRDKITLKSDKGLSKIIEFGGKIVGTLELKDEVDSKKFYTLSLIENEVLHKFEINNESLESFYIHDLNKSYDLKQYFLISNGGSATTTPVI